MERFFRLSLIGLLFISCAKSPGFKASEYDYPRVEANAQGDAKPATLKPGSIVRTSNKIAFMPISSDDKWDPQNVHLKANVKFGEKSFGDVEFQGRKKDSKILLEPVDPQLKDNLKAMMICTSEGNGCDDFFVDVYYRDNEIIYHDQFPAIKKTETSAKSSVENTQPKAPVKPAQQTPKVDDKKPAQGTPAPVKPPTQNTPPLKPKNPKNKDSQGLIQELVKDTTVGSEEIPDGVSEADEKRSSYVGADENEVHAIFNIPSPKETESEPVKESDKQPPKSPVKNPGQQAPPSSPAKQSQPPTQNGSADPLQKFRVKDQVIGSPSQGRLQNGTDFLKLSGLAGSYFFIAKPSDKDYFGAFDMAIVLKKIGEALQTFMPGRKLAITSISKWGGGRLAPHQGHQNGTDADVRYLTDDANDMGSVVFKGKVIPKFLVANQWKLLKKTFQTNMVDVVFVDPAVKRSMCEEARRVHDYQNGDSNSPGAEVLKRIQTWPKHDNHFHIRIRCSSDNPRCKQIQMDFSEVGC